MNPPRRLHSRERRHRSRRPPRTRRESESHQRVHGAAPNLRRPRDPRGHVVTIAHYALVRPDEHTPEGATDAREAAWFLITKIPPLAFDHAEILTIALTRLRGKIHYQPIGFELLPKHFTLSEIQSLYEAILGREIDKRNFRKKLLSFGFLIPLKTFSTGSHRPARLHRFDKRKYHSLQESGLNFELYKPETRDYKTTQICIPFPPSFPWSIIT